jgi:hypothetical protein
MADNAIRYEVIAEPFYTVDGRVYRDFDVKVGDILVVVPEENEPDEDGDMIGDIERTGVLVDIALEVLKRVPA